MHFKGFIFVQKGTYFTKDNRKKNAYVQLFMD